jgi:inorganic phosphate transporter, PiT family
LGVIILLAVLTGLSGAIYWRSRAAKVDHSNVNDEWSGGDAPAEPEPAAAA